VPEANHFDVGYYLFIKSQINDDLKYSLLTNHFKPDNKYKFPTLKGEDRNRHFQLKWLTENPFLVYSPCIEGCYCINCVLFPNVFGQSLGVFVETPCFLYKHLKHYSKTVNRHSKSQFHRGSTMCADNFRRTFEQPSLSIVSLIDKERFELIERNKAVLLSIIKIVITCARQNMPLRGHREEKLIDIRKTLNCVDSSSGSNFVALLKQRVDSGDEVLKCHLENGPRNSSFISGLVQNEIIECIHETILKNILRRSKDCVYCIIVDETTDTSTTEQISFSLRYYDESTNDIREDFITFIDTVSCTGESIANIILDYLKRYGLPLDNCVHLYTCAISLNEENVIDVDEVIFVHDKAPCMKANMTQQLIKDNNIKFWGNIIWPGNSPNLNVAEHIGTIIKDEVDKRMLSETGSDRYSEETLKKYIVDVLQNMETDTELFENRLRSYPSRLRAVKKANGGHTDY
ncbi:unnamed protein product, partial [Didymodactylos carnosus]